MKRLIGMTIPILCVIMFVWSNGGEDVTRSPQSISAAGNSSQEKAKPTSNGWGASPFAVGEPPVLDIANLAEDRKRRMGAKGYATPEAYYYMNLRELSVRADKNDVSALLQLGERYWTEADTLPYDQASILSDDPRKLATGYFLRAARGGALMVIGVVADRMSNSGDPVEAAAWNIVAKHYGQAVEQSAPGGWIDRLTVAQRGAAQERAEFVALVIGMPIGPSPVSATSDESHAEKLAD